MCLPLPAIFKAEGSQLATNCSQLKMPGADGKMRETDAADPEQILRLIQSVPSKKAEPFKLWLAKVGNDRIDEMADPELAINRALDFYAKKGYSKARLPAVRMGNNDVRYANRLA